MEKQFSATAVKVVIAVSQTLKSNLGLKALLSRWVTLISAPPDPALATAVMEDESLETWDEPSLWDFKVWCLISISMTRYIGGFADPSWSNSCLC